MAKTLAQGRKPGSGRKPGKGKTLREGRKPGSGRRPKGQAVSNAETAAKKSKSLLQNGTHYYSQEQQAHHLHSSAMNSSGSNGNDISSRDLEALDALRELTHSPSFQVTYGTTNFTGASTSSAIASLPSQPVPLPLLSNANNNDARIVIIPSQTFLNSANQGMQPATGNNNSILTNDTDNILSSGNHHHQNNSLQPPAEHGAHRASAHLQSTMK